MASYPYKYGNISSPTTVSSIINLKKAIH